MEVTAVFADTGEKATVAIGKDETVAVLRRKLMRAFKLRPSDTPLVQLSAGGEAIEEEGDTPVGGTLGIASGETISLRVARPHKIRAPGTYSGHTQWVRVVRLSPCSQWLLTSSGDETIKVWETATGQCAHTLKVEGMMVDAIVPSPDWAHLYTLAGVIFVWSTESWGVEATLEGQWSSLAISKSGDKLYAANPHSISIISTATYACEREVEIELRGRHLAESPCGKYLYAAGESGLCMWRVGRWSEPVCEDPRQCDVFVVSPCGTTLYASCGFAEQMEDQKGRGRVFLLDAMTLEVTDTIDCSKLPNRQNISITNLGLSACGEKLYCVGSGVSVWDTHTLTYLGMVTNQSGYFSLAIHPDAIIYGVGKTVHVARPDLLKKIGRPRTFRVFPVRPKNCVIS
eukprot:TRINITY_DN59571_c0_g1_i1.p1 TRINITY_DN59571_c0_g1~~TRINITY_DN59571_c0_g1_i1.p1  ORF type:complete len:401 (+),score=112.93 TRINITY_DN59571_c0_g1_i1:275-1477(+)